MDDSDSHTLNLAGLIRQTEKLQFRFDWENKTVAQNLWEKLQTSRKYFQEEQSSEMGAKTHESLKYASLTCKQLQCVPQDLSTNDWEYTQLFFLRGKY